METRNVSLSSVTAILGRNFCRSDRASFTLASAVSDITKLATDIACKGFLLSQGRLGLTPVVESDKKLAVESMEALHKFFKDSRDNYDVRTPDGKRLVISSSDLLRSFEEVYIPSGKVKVTHEVVYGFRRYMALILANAIRYKLGQPYIDTLTVDIEVYENEVDRIDACLLENANKGIGTRALTVPDYIHVGIEMFNHSVPEVRFRDMFRPIKGIDGQKLYNVVRTIIEYPDLMIDEQIKAGNVSWAKLDKEALRKLCNEKVPESAISEYLTNLNDGTQRAKKILDKKNIEALSKQCPDIVCRELAQGIYNAEIASWNAKWVQTAKWRNIVAHALLKPDLAPKVMALCSELEPLVKTA